MEEEGQWVRLSAFEAGGKPAGCWPFARPTAPRSPTARGTGPSLVGGNPTFMAGLLARPPRWWKRPGTARLGGHADGLRIPTVLAWLAQFWLTQILFKLIYNKYGVLNLLRFNQGKGRVLPLGRNNPRHQDRLGVDLLGAALQRGTWVSWGTTG